MLRDATIVAQLGTADMRAARAFYVDRLGLPLMMDLDEIIVCQATDRSALIVYSRPGHRAPDNTVASFLVSDLEAEVAELRGIGVSFEEYDMPGIRTLDGIASMHDGNRAAWFKDPDGNILALNTRPPV